MNMNVSQKCKILPICYTSISYLHSLNLQVGVTNIKLTCLVCDVLFVGNAPGSRQGKRENRNANETGKRRKKLT